jgi:hypothetical protein
MIRGDSTDYELLEKWSKGFDCQGFKSCEIGVREGLGSKIIMDNVVNNYIHVGVDPYGRFSLPTLLMINRSYMAWIEKGLLSIQMMRYYAK